MSHDDVPEASGTSGRFNAAALEAKPHWSVAESAFWCGFSVRTVWRLMSDPRSGFPKPRRVGRRTLLAAAEVMRFMAADTSRT